MSKISIFSANYLPNTGGVERYTYNLSKELASRGHKITIVTSNVFNLTEYEILSDGIEIYRLPCINLLNGRFPVLKFWTKDFRSLHKQIKENNFDLTIVNTRFYLHSLYGAIIGKKHSKNVIAIEHGSAHLTVNSKFWDFLGHIFEHSITLCIKHFIKDFYGVSKTCNEWLTHFKINAKGVLYNAVDVSDIQKIQASQQPFDSKKYNIPNDAKIISFTGRLVHEKGIIQLIEAVKKLNNDCNHKDIHLLVAGNGPLEDECNRIKNSNIHLLGKLDFNHIVSMLMVSSIFCLPTRSEGFTTSGLEAAATDNYIIATPVGGIVEIVLDSAYGTILSPEPAAGEIAKAILDIIDDKEKQKSACKKCYDRVMNNFTWKQTAGRVENIINNIL